MKFTIEFDKDEFKQLLEALFAPLMALSIEKMMEKEKQEG